MQTEGDVVVMFVTVGTLWYLANVILIGNILLKMMRQSMMRSQVMLESSIRMKSKK